MSQSNYTEQMDYTYSNANVSQAEFEERYQLSVSDPEAFWGEEGKRLVWSKPYTKVKKYKL